MVDHRGMHNEGEPAFAHIFRWNLQHHANERTRPVLAIFERKEIVARFDAVAAIDEVQTSIRKACSR